MKWIDVKEELPETYDTYDSFGNEYADSCTLVTDLGIGLYRVRTKEGSEETVGNWYLLDGDPKYNCRNPEDVSYWMPIPQYKVEE